MANKGLIIIPTSEEFTTFIRLLDLNNTPKAFINDNCTFEKKDIQWLCVESGMYPERAANCFLEYCCNYNPEFIIIYGISGGNSEVGCRFGDVIISDEIWDAEKYRVRYFGVDYEQEPFKFNIQSYLNQVAIKVIRTKQWISKIRYLYSDINDPHIQNYNNSTTRIHFGITASSNVILDRLDIEPMKTLRNQTVSNNLYGFEMEAKGLLRYIESLRTKDFMMIRGISDLPFLDKTKQRFEFSSNGVRGRDAKFNYHSIIRDKWKPIALESAFIILMEVLDNIDLRAYKRFKKNYEERPMPLPSISDNSDFLMNKDLSNSLG